MRKLGLQTIYELAKADKNIVFIGSDLGPGTLQEFKDTLPQQFFMEGISESHIIGMAAGMANCGAIVYVNTIASFLTRRCFDQIAINLCLDNTNVRLYGNGGGLVYGPLGGTHTAIEDIALMSSLPNMTVLAPADANEMEDLIKKSHRHLGPIYIRLAKGGDKIITTKNTTEIGIAKYFPKNTHSSSETLICTTGIMLQRAFEVREILESEMDIDILHFPTIKPLDQKSILQYAKNKKLVVTLEEHVATGGLGSQIASSLLKQNCRIHSFLKLSLPDKFPTTYGRQEELLELYELDAASIAKKVIERIH